MRRLFLVALIFTLGVSQVHSLRPSESSDVLPSPLTFHSGRTHLTLCDGGRTLCRVTDSWSGLEFLVQDFTGTHPSTRGELNSTFSVALSETPWNEGSWEEALSVDCGRVDVTPIQHTEATFASMLQMLHLKEKKSAMMWSSSFLNLTYYQYTCTSLMMTPRGARTASNLTVVFKIATLGSAQGEVPSSSSRSDESGDIVFYDLRVWGNESFVSAVKLPHSLTTKGSCAQDGRDDVLILPAAGGATIERPGQYWFDFKTKYPDQSHLQFFGRQCADTETGRKVGLYVATQDSNGHVKGHNFSPRREGYVGMQLTHQVDQVLEVQGNPTTQVIFFNYSIIISTIPVETNAGTNNEGNSGWRSFATKYKNWATQQHWTRLNLTQRTNIPGWLTEGVAGMIYGINGGEDRNFNPTPFGPELELMADNFTLMKNKTGVKTFLGTVYGWEHDGVWAGIKYFPPQPSFSAWQAASTAIHATGNRVALLVSGYWWVVARQATHNGPAFNHTSDLSNSDWTGMLVKSKPDGELWELDEYNQPTGKQNWRGLSTYLCHGAPNSTVTMSNIFATVSNDVGADVISFDQDIGGGQKPGCWDPTHPHPPGHGSWMYEGYRENLETIRRKSQNKELILMEEQVSELVIQYTGTYWSRQFGVMDYPIGGARPRGMFNYIYHEFTTTIAAALVQGIDCTPRSNSGCGVSALKAMANAVSYGMILMPFQSYVYSPPTGPLAGYGEAYFSYTKAMQRHSDHFFKGIMIDPPHIQCDSLNVTWGPTEEAAAKKKGKDHQHPAPQGHDDLEDIDWNQSASRVVPIDVVSVGAFEWQGERRLFITSILDHTTTVEIVFPHSSMEVTLKKFEVWSMKL